MMTRPRIGKWLLGFGLLITALAAPAHAEKRVALVIGNNE